MTARKQRRRNATLALAMAIFVLCALALGQGALALGYTFESLQNSDPAGVGYVPKNVELKKAKLPLVIPKDRAYLYTAPDAALSVAGREGSDFYMRYLGTEGDFYRCLTFSGEIVYIEISQAQRLTKRVDFAQYPAGSYVVGRTVVLSERVDEADPVTGVMETISYGEYETRPWSEPVLEGTQYYLRPQKGKTATAVVSSDPEGKEVLRRVSSSAGELLYLEEGQYVTVKNGVLYHAYLAPVKVIDSYIAAHPDAFDPGEGIPNDMKDTLDSHAEMVLFRFV